MNKHFRFLLIAGLLLFGCVATLKKNPIRTETAIPEVKRDTLTLFDSIRQRTIPIAVYGADERKKQPLVIFSHGYGANAPTGYLVYSYLTEFLASNGFFVVSIQHELATDSLIPTDGIPQIVRRPFWDRGADNIHFVLNELKKSHPDLDFQHVSLIGHSNGGDMSALYPQKYPGLVSKIITLDNRRMALPRTTFPAIYSLRSNDTPADEGVLPTEKEQQTLGITIIRLQNTGHSDMDDTGSTQQKRKINEYLLRFLKE